MNFTKIQDNAILSMWGRNTPVRAIASHLNMTEETVVERHKELEKIEMQNEIREGCETLPNIDTIV